VDGRARIAPLLACVVVLAGCGSRAAPDDWVASEVFVVDDRSACMSVRSRADGRELAVCRDDAGHVSCRNGPRPDDLVGGADCDAAQRAVRTWEEGATPA
jgi:hypothetical protein